MFMRKTFIIIIAVSVTLLIVLVWFFHVPSSGQNVLSRCTDYNPEWLGMVDCYGVVSIWQPNNSGYLVENNAIPGSIIAQIQNQDSFVVRSDRLYLRDITPKGICNNLVPGKYCGNFQVDGEQKTFYYDSPDRVPTYLIINTKTGDEQFYIKPQDASSADQSVFQELLTKESTRPWYSKLWNLIQ
jgi:hypothetical protein